MANMTMATKDLIPSLKKKASSFMKEERGTISKQSLMSVGAAVSAIAAAGLLAKEADAAAISISSSDDGVNVVATASHSHHSSHSSHGSHGSHSSHGSHGSHSSSDRRLKGHIRRIDDSLKSIQCITGVRFRWKENGRPDMGVIAQDVEKAFPELVATDKMTGLKAVNYAGLIAPLIEAVKAQQRQIERLEEDLALLKKDLGREPLLQDMQDRPLPLTNNYK